ncbi:MAG: DNA repair protein RadC [Pseudoxanthomonas sp.]
MPPGHDTRQAGHMHIRDWPAEERPREKLLARGAGVLSDAELLAIFLGSGLRGRDAVQTSRELLAAHGPLRVLLENDPAGLARLPGLGPARACKLAAALELGHRHLAAALERGEVLTDPASAGRYFSQRLRGRGHEVFAALFLDTRHRALAFEELFQGTVDGAEVHPREVVRRALSHNAAAVIVGHNHPSGDAEPSAADRAVTARLKQALALVEVRLLDHFVVGDGPAVSLASRGWV